VQKLAGIINWIWPYLGLTLSQLKPLLELLKGDADIAALRSLTSEARQTVEMVEQAIQGKHVWRIELTVAVQVFVLIDDMIPFAMIVQWNPGWEDPLHVL
ncbi:POK18 protein, partial [Ceuthmochares aereus]|nr:POK18 protein [Ceuthmochares aereus]